MSYTRILEDGCYIYPESEKAGIKIAYFPDEELDFIPDCIFDVLVSKMTEKELLQRKKHGEAIRNKISTNNLKELSTEEKDFFKWREKYGK